MAPQWQGAMLKAPGIRNVSANAVQIILKF